MVRVVLVLVLVAGVTRAEAAPTSTKSKVTKKSAKTTKTTKAKVSKKSPKLDDKTGKKLAKSKRHKKGKTVARIPWKPSRNTLSRNDNMPHGFSWPPTRAMLAAEVECESKLDRANVVWERVEREGRIVNAILVPSMTFGGVKYSNMWGSKGPHKVDCQLALALETIGPELFALGVREVKFGSIYRWSHVRSHGQTRPILSRHGLGIAMDIGSFIDESGRSAVVKKDYTSGDELLLGIEQVINANGNFRIVLTPKNDPISHHDHFHIEAKADYTSPDVP